MKVIMWHKCDISHRIGLDSFALVYDGWSHLYEFYNLTNIFNIRIFYYCIWIFQDADDLALNKKQLDFMLMT